MENTLNILFGKTSTEHSQAIKGLTLEPCLKKSQKPKFQCLDLADGRTPEWSEGGQPTFHGVSWMPSIGEYPSEERGSTLWEIIETDVPLKYYLSPKACSGILRRAAKRGKELPKPLKEALERQAETPIEEILENAVPINCSQVYRICSYASNCMKSDNPNSGVYKTDINATLDLNGGNPACNQGGMCIVEGYVLNDQGGDSLNVEQDDISPTLRAQAHGNEPIVCYVLQGNMIGRQDQNGPKGSGISENLSYTLTASDMHAVCYPIMLENHPNDSRIKIDESGSCQTLTSRMGTGGGKGALWQENKSATIACNNDQYMFVPIVADDILYIVRRLTPRECARLQGFPIDWHEDITNAKDKTLPDSAAYKGYGNAVATVCAEKPVCGIIDLLRTGGCA